MKIRLTLPMETQSGNTYLRQHWSKRDADKHMWDAYVLLAVGKSETMAKYQATGPRALTIVRYGKRRCDIDNVVSGCKGLIDAIREHGLLLDDDPDSMVSLTVRNGKLEPKQNPFTEIILEDV
jgi:Holliday junction resolvase RusA-like endonuclease